ncbi:MAG: DUF29 domain-containing protein, partial [Brasilonema sp.]
MNLTLYDKDFYLWLEETVQLLQERRLSELDIPNLIDEIAEMAKSQKKAVKSNLTVILWHLLKYKYQPEKRTNSWRLTLFEHRDRLQESFADSPSLIPFFREVFNESYGKARQKAAIETG